MPTSKERVKALDTLYQLEMKVKKEVNKMDPVVAEEGKVSTPRVIHVMNREKDILPVAEETIEKMLRPLYQEGHKAGYDDGYNKGYAQGYAKAIEWALKRLTEGGK